MAAKHWNPVNNSYEKNSVDVSAQDDFPYELPNWMKSYLEEYPEHSFENSKETRTSYLAGKTSLSDEDILHILNLPPEKYELKSTSIKYYTDKAYNEIKDNSDELEILTEELKTDPEYLNYRNSKISKSKLLFQDSTALYNEIPCLILLEKMNKPAYLLPYRYAQKDGEEKKFADALEKDVFTDFKRVFNSKIKMAFLKGTKQGKNVFFLVNNKKLNKNILKKQLIERIKYRQAENKEGLFLFFSEKDFICNSFEVSKEGRVEEVGDVDLKEMRLAKSKPLPYKAMDLTTPSYESNIKSFTKIVNTEKEFFYSLMSRGAIEILSNNKDIENHRARYVQSVVDLMETNNQIFTESIRSSNEEFIQKEINGEKYKTWSKEVLSVETPFDYHGTILTISENQSFGEVSIIEPAFDVKLLTLEDDKLTPEEKKGDFTQTLDNLAQKDETCLASKSDNYLPAIAAKIITENKEIKNPNINKSFVSKVQELKQKIQKELKKGVAITVAISSIFAASPKLFADTNKNVILQTNISTEKTRTTQEQNIYDIYKDLSPDELMDELVRTKIHNQEISKENSKLKSDKEKLVTQNDYYYSLLYKHATIEVNGKKVEAHDGLIKGFGNAVSKVFTLAEQTNNLKSENKVLKNMVQNRDKRLQIEESLDR